MDNNATAKKVGDSYTEQIQLLDYSNMNGYRRLFGGTLMAWIDVVAAVVARRHSGCNVTTASVSRLSFEAPAFLNEMIVLCGYITYVGNTSMEVCVESFVEDLQGNRRKINTAYLTMVAIDDNDRPCPVPGLIIETEEQREKWDEARERKRNGKK